MDDDDTIIRVDDRKIGFQEFQSRLNYLPQTLKLPEKEIKETLVCTLIAETILSYEARHRTLDTLEQVRRRLSQYSHEAVYEQWMSSEVRARIKVTERELLSAYTRFTERRSVAYWILPDRKDATALREKIARGTAPAEKPAFKDIDYAEALESVENEVYGLKAGEISSPVPVDGSYYVFQLLKRLPHPEHSKNNFLFWKPSVEKKVRARKEVSMLDSRLVALMKGKEYSVRRETYDFLVKQLASLIFDTETPRFQSPELIQQEIGAQDIGPRGILDQPLITFNDGGEWTVGEFWKKLSVCPYPLNYKNPEELKTGLLGVMRNIILFESIVQDGMKKGYDRSPEAQSEYEMWGRNVLAYALMDEYRNSVSIREEDLVQYYDSTKNRYLQPERRRIIPIIVRDKGIADRLQQQISGGAEIVSLARTHSINTLNLDGRNPGVIITRDDWGKIGEVAFELHPGEVSATFRNSDTTFTILKVLETIPSAPYPFDAIRSRLRLVKEERQVQQKVEEFLARVVKDFEITVNRKALGKVEYLGGTLAVRKSHFPLRSAVPGFPLFNPKAQWYAEGVAKN